MSTDRCLRCGNFLEIPKTGRHPRYCSARCKEAMKRKRRREEGRALKVAAQASVGDSLDEGAPCHVCAQSPATVGTPAPVLCSGCAHP